MRQLDFHGHELRIIDAALGRIALRRPKVKRLITVPGVDATIALSIIAAIGDIRRFRRPSRWFPISGSTAGAPVRRAARRPRKGHQHGRAHARGMLVEAIWVAVRTPGPLRAFFERIRARRGMQIAVVATAHKLAMLGWQLITKDEDYAFARPSLTEKKMQSLELRAGMPARRGRKGNAAAHNLTNVRRRELQLSEQAERTYRQLVSDWHAKAPTPGVAAANGTRLKRPSAGQAARQASVPEPVLRSGVDRPHTQA